MIESPMDPRVRRTRKMLHDAMASLLKRKDFADISVNDLAEESTLSRVTFYGHYPDKEALLKSLVESQFQQVLEERNIQFDGGDTALRQLTLAVCYYLAGTPRSQGSDIRQASGPIEAAIVAVIRALIVRRFTKLPPKPGVPVELLASTMAWAVYGGALEWAERPEGKTVEQAGTAIETLIRPMLSAAMR
jgi:AcrR family transcriptional regulator